MPLTGRWRSTWDSRRRLVCFRWFWWRFRRWSDHGGSGPDETRPAEARKGTFWKSPFWMLDIRSRICRQCLRWDDSHDRTSGSEIEWYAFLVISMANLRILLIGSILLRSVHFRGSLYMPLRVSVDATVRTNKREWQTWRTSVTG